MELPINPDPQNLNRNMLGGRKWWQWLCIAVAFIIAIVFTVFFQNKLDSTVNSIICAILVVPVGYVGIFQKNGLDFFEYYKQKKANLSGTNVFLYVNEPPEKKMLVIDKKQKKKKRR